MQSGFCQKRPDETGYVPYPQKKRFLKEWLLQGKMFMIYCAPKKWGPEVVRFVEEHYGPLDYDFVAEKEKLHPKRKEWWKE